MNEYFIKGVTYRMRDVLTSRFTKVSAVVNESNDKSPRASPAFLHFYGHLHLLKYLHQKT
jgi:hypothetical protein